MNTADGILENVEVMPAEEKDEYEADSDSISGSGSGDAVGAFLRQGKVFQGGNAPALHRLLQLSAGDRLLYVGDRKFSII